MTDLESFASTMIAIERYSVEVLLILCSTWAGVALWSAAGFASYGNYFHYLENIDQNENHWALFIGGIAFAKALGLFLCLAFQRPYLGVPLRLFGLTFSGFFWLLIGFSSLTTNPASIGGAPMVLIGLSAWWVIIRYPTVPPMSR